ncbi:hypothetical protein GH714_000056 [Hevea brasiliensis]|uniref:Uncharacterized protein n=1 Tax=Hevea brasiliensis TaxID=3981 RepID=A0A6A6N812_HEVBR|nr:hypothetical protein GH714_000056 [Hevea brasiliensis]
MRALERPLWGVIEFSTLLLPSLMIPTGTVLKKRAVAEQAAWDVAKEKGGPSGGESCLGAWTTTAIHCECQHYSHPQVPNWLSKTYANSVQAYVHVKDVALAHILVYETPSAPADISAPRTSPPWRGGGNSCQVPSVSLPHQVMFPHSYCE